MLGSSSGDVVARQEVVAAATAHRVRPVASSTDNVEALQVLRSAVAWLHLVAASTVMLAKSQWMDWSTVSSPQSGTCRELGSMITGSTVAIGPVSECGEFGPVGLEV